MTPTDEQRHAGASRRSFLTKMGFAAGVAWTTPQIFSQPAASAGTLPSCGDSFPPGYTRGYFSWGWTGYSINQRSGLPGSGDILTFGWNGHPTYTTYCAADSNTSTPPCSGGTTTGVTINYRLIYDASYINTSNDAESTGVKQYQNAAPWWGFRVAKDNRPPVGNVITMVIQFSVPVLCPRVEIGDVDNAIPASTPVGYPGSSPANCTGAAGTGGQWADRIVASAWTGYNMTGVEAPVQRVNYQEGPPVVAAPPGRVSPYGDNVYPAPVSGPLGVGEYWYAGLCASIPQTQDRSMILVRAQGLVREMRIDFVSGFQATAPATGRQHIAIGNIDFGYVP